VIAVDEYEKDADLSVQLMNRVLKSERRKEIILAAAILVIILSTAAIIYFKMV